MQKGKNNKKNNKTDNRDSPKEDDLCLRLRILFVSFGESIISKMCAIPKDSLTSKQKREAVTVSLFVLFRF